VALLENALHGAQRGTTLTKRLLAFARRQELKQQVVDIPQLIRGMTDLLQRSLGPSVSVQTRFPLVIKPALADANQLEMALLNLTVNARDAMPNGGQIVVATREESILAGDATGLEPGRYICLTVSDTGTGMDEATLKRATEPFLPQRDQAKAPGSAFPWYTGLLHNVEDASPCKAERVKAQPPSFGSRSQKRKRTRLITSSC
jgi:signal transduction histidine kinase